MNCWYKDVCNQHLCNDSCIRYKEMLALMQSSNLPPSKQYPITITPDDCDYDAFCELADIKSNIKEFVASGKNLYIYSSVTGNGKTTWAIKLMLKYFSEVWAGNGFKPRGVFVHVPTFLNQLKDFSNNQRSEISNIDGIPLTDIDLVIWDDVASTDLSAYDNSQLLSYVDSRILNEKSNIFTGNRGQKELEKAIGTRLASRVWNTSTQIQLKGSDKR